MNIINQDRIHREKINQFFKEKSKKLQEVMDQIREEYKIKEKAYNRANRDIKTPYISNVSKLQEQLFKIGAYDDKSSFKREVDGIIGRRTLKAIQKAKDMGYTVNQKKGTVSKSPELSHNRNIKQNKNSNILIGLRELTRQNKAGFFPTVVAPVYLDSKRTGLPAILDHKVNSNVNDNYGVVDKINSILYIFNKNNLLASYPVTLGDHIGDGMSLKQNEYYSQLPGTTGAGVFTIRSVHPTSPYLGHEPMFIMHNSNSPNRRFYQALHSPANSTDRLAPFKNPKISNRVSRGCVAGNCGVMTDIYNKKLLQPKDSVYVLPEVPGNDLVEHKGKLQMFWGGNNPKTYVDKDGNVHNFEYNTNI